MAIEGIVVSESTTLIALCNIKSLPLLSKFSQKIIIPNAVYTEITLSNKNLFAEYSGFLEAIEVKNRKLVDELGIRLDIGESEAIALALELQVPLIIDEKKGRKFAKEIGVKTIGLVGILALLREKDILSKTEAKEIIEKLKSVNFWISDELARFVLELE